MFLKKSSTLILSSLLCLAIAQPAAAGQPPFPNKVISINARGQKIADVITDVFTQAGLKVKVSSAVTGQAQGMFVGSPGEIWTNISRAYNLVAYYDGAVVRVNSANEITTRTIQSDAAAEVVKEAKRLGWADSNNQVKASGGAILASGVPDFLAQIDRLSRNTRPAPPPPPKAVKSPPAVIATPMQPAAPSVPPVQPTMVASPLISGADYYKYSPSDVAYQVQMRAGPGRRYETRVYRIKYRDVVDRDINMQGRMERVPGVVSLLLEHMGRDSGINSNRSNQYSRDDGYYNRRDARDRYYDDRGSPYEDQEAPSRRDTAGPTVIADVTNNSVIVKDLPSEMNQYTALIAELDREQPVIDFEVVSLVYNRDDMTELGVDWSLGFGGLSMVFGGRNRNAGSDISGSYVWGNGDVINAQIRALQEQGTLQVTDRQFISAINNKSAEYNEGGQQYAKLQGQYNSDLKALDYGLSVNIKPAIINETDALRVRMDIQFRDTTLTNQSVDGIPSIKGPSFTLSNIVPHGQAVLLAGRTVNFEYDKKSKTPLLGDIPVFGNAFKRRHKGVGTMERAVMIIPRVRAPGSTGIPMRTQPVVNQPIPTVQPVMPKKRRAG